MLITFVAAAPVCATATIAAESGSIIKGNPKSKVYHKSSCQHYNSKGATESFKNEAEAKQAGFKPCKQCSVAKPEKDAKPAEK